MRIKTNLPHEAKGGKTFVAFSKATSKIVDKKKIIYVGFYIIKTVLKKGDNSSSSKCFCPRLNEFQKKRILKYAKELALNYYLDKLKIWVLPKKLHGTLSILKGGDNHCHFYMKI